MFPSSISSMILSVLICLLSFSSTILVAATAPLPLKDPTIVPSTGPVTLAPSATPASAGNPSLIDGSWALLIAIVLLPGALMTIGCVVGCCVYRRKYKAGETNNNNNMSTNSRHTNSTRNKEPAAVEMLQTNPALGHETYADDV